MNGWKGGKRRICSGARTTEKVVEEKYLLVIGGGRSGGMKKVDGWRGTESTRSYSQKGIEDC